MPTCRPPVTQTNVRLADVPRTKVHKRPAQCIQHKFYPGIPKAQTRDDGVLDGVIDVITHAIGRKATAVIGAG